MPFPASVAVVREKTRINKNRLTSDADGEGKSVGMAVRCARNCVVPESAGLLTAIEREIVGIRRPGGSEHNLARVCERACRRRLTWERVELVLTIGSEQPEGFLMKTAGRKSEVRSTEQHRTYRLEMPVITAVPPFENHRPRV